jgi:RNA polymerase sigma factor (sigma-70 family)
MSASSAEFLTTHWSLVLQAGKPEGEAAQEALSSLCRRYWLPLYAFVRRRVGNVALAQDLTQEFFARVIEKGVLASAAPERGRFRWFLLASMKHFLANEVEKAAALKRGGGRRCFSLDFSSGETRMQMEPVDHLTPERIFDRQWTLELLRQVIERLEQEYIHDGKQTLFQTLQPFLAGGREGGSYSEAAATLGMSDDAVRQAASRLRKRYREILREEVAQTVATPEEVDDEIRSLMESLGN